MAALWGVNKYLAVPGISAENRCVGCQRREREKRELHLVIVGVVAVAACLLVATHR